MPYKTTLPWRKFPRDTLHNPSLLFIINRMEKEHRQAVFTVFLGLYCEADDDGFVDISDEEFFADQCLTDADTLNLILQHFEKRHLIEKVLRTFRFIALSIGFLPIRKVGVEKQRQSGKKNTASGKKKKRKRTKKPLPPRLWVNPPPRPLRQSRKTPKENKAIMST